MQPLTTHTPFRPVPPLQADPARLLKPKPIDEGPLQRAQPEKVDWLNPFPDDVRVFDCTYRWLAAFFPQPEPRETVCVIVGGDGRQCVMGRADAHRVARPGPD